MSVFEERLQFRPFSYPQAEKFTDWQRKNFWDAKKIVISGDIQDYRTTFSPGMQHAITTSLKLFTHYEVGVGDYWSEVVYKWCRAHEIQGMASMFSAMELAVHAIFYDRLNNELGLSSKEFYTSFLEDDNMSARMNSIKEYMKVDSKEDFARSIAIFSFIEGVVLYSSFAFLMSFQANGMNKLSSVVTGLRYSVKDEAIHADAGSWLFNQVCGDEGFDKQALEPAIVLAARTLVAQEDLIVDEMFREGGIKHISADNLKMFVRSRMNKKMEDIGYKPMFEIGYNPVAEWFYDMINAQEFTDFFHNESTSYEMTADFSLTKYKVWA